MLFSQSGDLSIIDTPGLRRLAIRNINLNDLSAYFPKWSLSSGSAISAPHVPTPTNQAVPCGRLCPAAGFIMIATRAISDTCRAGRIKAMEESETGKPQKAAKYRFEDEE
jgi:hypothetical protein